jgi:hypothetical protein
MKKNFEVVVYLVIISIRLFGVIPLEVEKFGSK